MDSNHLNLNIFSKSIATLNMGRMMDLVENICSHTEML
jgi:hypothetical protein